MTRTSLKGGSAIFLFCAVASIASSAQTFTTLHSFDSTDGQAPSAGLVQAINGELYGTTMSGGTIALAHSLKSLPAAR